MSIEVKISSKRVSYKKAMFILEKRVESVKKGKKKEFLWILEHPTTFTAGIRSKQNEILDKNIKVIPVALTSETVGKVASEKTLLDPLFKKLRSLLYGLNL